MLFYELIQVAVGQRDILSHNPSEEEWIELFEMSQKQAIAGIAFAALDKLSAVGQKPPLNLLYEWIGMSEQIRQGNLRLNKYSRQLQKKLSESGLRSSILKGQGILSFYDEHLRELRQSGDIDIYVDCGREKALEWAKSKEIAVESWDYKHAHLNIWDDVEVEMHYHVEVLLNLLRNRKLQRWFKEHEELMFCDRDGLTTPTTAFNRFYVLLHIYRHFLYEGVGMRQLMDYYVLRADDADNCSFGLELTLKKFGMWRFARGIMWVMQEVFALDRSCMIAEPMESEGRFILNEIMAGGNFGHHDERINKRRKGKLFTVLAICKHNWHLLWHYPSEVIWPPIWFVWHKCWKWQKQKKLK